jgi:hypothetical protein
MKKIAPTRPIHRALFNEEMHFFISKTYLLQETLIFANWKRGPESSTWLRALSWLLRDVWPSSFHIQILMETAAEIAAEWARKYYFV